MPSSCSSAASAVDVAVRALAVSETLAAFESDASSVLLLMAATMSATLPLTVYVPDTFVDASKASFSAAATGTPLPEVSVIDDTVATLAPDTTSAPVLSVRPPATAAGVSEMAIPALPLAAA